MQQTIFTSLPIGDLETLIINCVTACLKSQAKTPNTPNTSHKEQPELLTVQETAAFLSLSVPTIYGLIHKGELPNLKQGKRCYFLKKDLLAYLEQGRRKSNAEIEKDAAAAFKKFKK